MPMISKHDDPGKSTNSILYKNRNPTAMGETDLTQTEFELIGVKKLLWGEHVKEDVFRRWSQGFVFSADEPSALVQAEGGPCAAIAPVQGFILKILLAETPGHCFQDLTSEKCNSLLVRAICNVLAQCFTQNYKIVVLKRVKRSALEGCSYDPDGTLEEDRPLESGSRLSPLPLSNEDLPKSELFHRHLYVCAFDSLSEVESFYSRNLRILTDQYGVLLLLYSVILSKGVECVKSELSELSDPLIHATYGYGSQGLINLMLTGRAVAHVWDHDQMAGGLRLSGIDRQSDVGFITIMEHMQYCTVGSFYKNPKNPVWVMASETHLTILFSFEKKLVSPETAVESAKRIFRSFDPEGNNFIPSVLLQDVLCAMDLVSDSEYVDIMRKKLDSENLGIILLNSFMEEFFAGSERSTPDTFTIFHYNGLSRSNPNGRVVFHQGNAVLLESDLLSVCESNPMLTCLQTKWPNIDVSWNGGKTPSLN